MNFSKSFRGILFKEFLKSRFDAQLFAASFWLRIAASPGVHLGDDRPRSGRKTGNEWLGIWVSGLRSEHFCVSENSIFVYMQVAPNHTSITSMFIKCWMLCRLAHRVVLFFRPNTIVMGSINRRISNKILIKNVLVTI